MDISRIVYSAMEPRKRDVLWLRPIGNGVSLYIWNGGWSPLRVVNDRDTLTVYDDTVIDVEHIDEKTDEILAGMYYKDLFIGVGSELQDILTTKNHFSVIKKGTNLSYPDAEGSIFMAVSSENVPTILMSSVKVPFTQGEDAMIEGKTYHIWQSDNTYPTGVSIVLV